MGYNVKLAARSKMQAKYVEEEVSSFSSKVTADKKESEWP
jgi:hypothetical protein